MGHRHKHSPERYGFGFSERTGCYAKSKNEVILRVGDSADHIFVERKHMERDADHLNASRPGQHRAVS